MAGKIKTTISIDEDLWQEFSIAVIKKHGYRAKNRIIESLISWYVESEKRGVAAKYPVLFIEVEDEEIEEKPNATKSTLKVK